MVDLNLSGVESYPIADALVARDVPYFFSTGSSVADIKDGYRDQDVLKKPFTFEQTQRHALPFIASTNQCCEASTLNSNGTLSQR